MSAQLVNWSTADAPAGQAVARWNAALARHLMQFNVRSDERSGFHGQLLSAPLASQQCVLIAVENRQQGEHQLASARAGRANEAFLLVHTRRGAFRVRSGDSRTVAGEGDCVLLSGTEPFRFESAAFTTCLVVRFEQAWLRNRIAAVDDCVGRPVDGSKGWGATLSSALWNIVPSAPGREAEGCLDLASQLAGLLGLAVTPEQGAGRGRHRALQARITHALAKRFDDSTLSPGAFARELGISRRYLHALFAERGTTFSTALYRLRVEHAATLLAGASGDRLRISEVAYACGFADAGHFSRHFRARFGMTPSAWRRARRGLSAEG